MSFDEDHALETYKSLMTYGGAGLKFVLTANGAAAVAVLTFLGHFVASGGTNAPDLRWPLGIFVGGAFLGGVATITAYFTQLTLYNESVGGESRKPKVSHEFWLRISIAVIVLGMAAFGLGSFLAVTRLH